MRFREFRALEIQGLGIEVSGDASTELCSESFNVGLRVEGLGFSFSRARNPQPETVDGAALRLDNL